MESRTTEVVDEVSKWTAGLGILTLALAPLSLPFLILTAAALAPLLLPLLALCLIGAVVAAPIVLVRRLLRARRPRRRGAVRTASTVPAASPPRAAQPGRP